MTITEFLTARYDEDERVTYNPALMPVSGPGLSDLVKRARADIAAKRRILLIWTDPVGRWTAEQADAARSIKERTLRYLAQPYAEHPDFDPAWRTV